VAIPAVGGVAGAAALVAGGVIASGAIFHGDIPLTDVDDVCDGGDDNGDDNDERCKKVKKMCIDECSDSSLPTPDFGFKYWNCLNACMRRNGC
jgi:hypothetical protein